MKTARGLHAAGRVVEAEWRVPELRGRVREGETEFRAGLRIVTSSDITNLCTCRTSRHQSMICAHSLAVGLECLHPRPKPDAKDDLRAQVQASGATPLTPEPTSVEGRVFSTQSGEPVDLAFVLTANLDEALGRGTVTLVPEISQPQRRTFAALTKGQTYRLSPQDFDAFQHIVAEAGGALPALLSLTRDRFATVLSHLADHPRVTLGRGATLQISSTPRRLTLHGEAQANGDLVLRVSIPDGVTVFGGPTSSWLFTKPARLEPAAIGFPAAYRAVFDRNITIPAAGVHGFLSHEAPVLEKFFDLQMPRVAVAVSSQEAPSVLLKLEGSLNHLDAELQARTSRASVTLTSPGFRPRDPAEATALGRLQRCGFTPAGGSWILKGEPAILRFFAGELPQLEKDWQVSVGARFAHVTRDLIRVDPKIEVRSSGQDWFEISLEFAAGGTERVAASEIRRLLSSGRRTITTANHKKAVLHEGLLSEFEEVLRDCNPDQRSPGVYRFDHRHAEYIRSLETAAGAKFHGRGAATLDSSADLIPLPLGRWETVLRPYQKDGVQWLKALKARNMSGILADEMGLGKTVQVLCFLSALEGCSLVICPSSLVINWQREADRFAPELRAYAAHGPNRWDDKPALASTRLIITSYALLRRDLDLYRNRQFACIALDEAQHIRNPQSQAAEAAFALQAPHRVAVTGTPIENSVRDIWSIMNFLMPGYLGSQGDFKERYEVPIAAAVNGPEHARLARRLKPFVLRRMKQQVAAELPEKLEQVILCELDVNERSTYAEILRHARDIVADLQGPSGRGKSRMAVLTMLLRLRQACLDRRLLGVESPDGHPGTSSKLELLAELLDEAIRDGHRVLVFSQFATMLRLIGERLSRDEIGFCLLDGSTRDRQAEVDRFQSGHAPVFLISLKAGGTGLNLTAADTVIHFDPWWNPAVEAQATDRAHRIGQTRVVTAYKLIARGTIEEKIVALQARKRGLANLDLDSEEPHMSGLTDDDLREIVSP